ncbi:MAG TPA: AMIN domain-containing protein [Terriglobales bacterium]|nr:AMIN domain-containing protein [Terriglobales bacterium]
MKDFPSNFASRPRLSRPRFPRFHRGWGAALLLATLAVSAQQPSPKTVIKGHYDPIASVKSFRIVQEKDGPAVEILSTKPLVPAIQVITDPDRLVIDLPNARLDAQQKRIAVQADQITSIRADQFQQNPPITRVVVDLAAPRAYTWDAAGNRLVVHLGKNPNEASSSPFQSPATPSLVPVQQPVVSAIRVAGPLALTGKDGTAGSTVTAGPDTAIVRLSSGGELHVCPGTTVAVTPSQNHHNLMLSMDSGAMEAHFGLDASSDTVMTPDFRIQLVGPGEFHYAFSADHQGNTCVRALPGNTASAIVSELLGDRTYQVKATDQLLFHSGQLDRVDMAVPLECGCPPPRDTPSLANNNLPTQAPNETQNKALPPASINPVVVSETPNPQASAANDSQPGGASMTASSTADTAPNDVHVQVEAPFVFHANGPPPLSAEQVQALPTDSRPKTGAPDIAAPLPPPSNETPKPAGAESATANRPQQRGFFKRLGGFFAALFR